MDAMNYNYNGYGYGTGMYGMPVQYQYPSQPIIQQPIQMPQNVNALTEEEIKIISAANPSKLDLNISQEDNLKAMCSHKHNGRDMVQLLNDGSGDVFCPICHERWSSERLSKEEITALVDQLIAQMQNSKWVGDLNIALIRDYYPMIPLLKKFPEIYDYAMQSFNKYYNQNGYNTANEAAIYAQYNNLMGITPQTYSNMYAPQQMMPQMQQPVQQPVQNVQNGYYGQAATTVNPMQVPYGVYQQPANTQFVDQANQMMGGSVYAPQQSMVPTYAPQQAAPVAGVNQQTATAPVEAANNTTETTTSVNLG